MKRVTIGERLKALPDEIVDRLVQQGATPKVLSQLLWAAGAVRSTLHAQATKSEVKDVIDGFLDTVSAFRRLSVLDPASIHSPTSVHGEIERRISKSGTAAQRKAMSRLVSIASDERTMDLVKDLLSSISNQLDNEPPRDTPLPYAGGAITYVLSAIGGRARPLEPNEEEGVVHLVEGTPTDNKSVSFAMRVKPRDGRVKLSVSTDPFILSMAAVLLTAGVAENDVCKVITRLHDEHKKHLSSPKAAFV